MTPNQLENLASRHRCRVLMMSIDWKATHGDEEPPEHLWKIARAHLKRANILDRKAREMRCPSCGGSGRHELIGCYDAGPCTDERCTA